MFNSKKKLLEVKELLEQALIQEEQEYAQNKIELALKVIGGKNE